MKYLIVIEWTGTDFSAYSLGLPGCISTRATREGVRRNMRDTIELYLEGLREEGYPVPENLALRRPTSRFRLKWLLAANRWCRS